jgi:hypothetical protein
LTFVCSSDLAVHEKILHARIPASLDREIRRRANGLGLSVSTVVRHVLLRTFDLVEDIVTDGANLAIALAGEEGRLPPSRSRAASSGEVLAWQEAILNVNAVCERCNALLPKGGAAAIGIRDGDGARAIICGQCLQALATEEDA